jgi:hypothetical protein
MVRRADGFACDDSVSHGALVLLRGAWEEVLYNCI